MVQAWQRWGAMVAMAMAAVTAALPLHAQTFPGRMITAVVPYPAGGASDFMARLVQPEYQRQLGQQMLVENVGGVSGALGIQKVLAAPADGHTQVLGTPMELVLAPLALSAVKFKPEELRTAALIATTSVVMLVRKDLPANNIDEFVAWAKGKQPTYGSVGIGSLYHLMAEKFAQQTGLVLTHVPYKGGAPLITDVAGGQVDLAFFPLAGPVPGMIREGKVKVLGISQQQPHPMLPDVPPLSRHRLLPGFDFDIWIGVQVPRSTPEAAVQRIHDAMAEVVKLPEVRKGIEGTGGQAPRPMTLAETERFYAAEIERYRNVAKSIKLQPQ